MKFCAIPFRISDIGPSTLVTDALRVRRSFAIVAVVVFDASMMADSLSNSALDPKRTHQKCSFTDDHRVPVVLARLLLSRQAKYYGSSVVTIVKKGESTQVLIST